MKFFNTESIINIFQTVMVDFVYFDKIQTVIVS